MERLFQILTIQILFLMHSCAFSAPLVQKIHNNTCIGYEIVVHGDSSSCSLANKGIIVDAYSTYTNDILLQLDLVQPESDENLQAGLVLKPIYFFDRMTGQKIDFATKKHDVISYRLQRAFEQWKHTSMHHKKITSARQWFDCWIGANLEVIPYEVEILGYLINLSKVRIKNAIQENSQYLSFAKGIFSTLLLELTIQESKDAGIFAKIKVFHGEGGFCKQGVIERL